MGDEQMILRRVYDDAGKLLREGQVPKDLRNDRATLMAYWQEEDRLKAEAEAEAAQAEVDRLKVPSESPVDELIGDLSDRLEALQEEVGELRERVKTVDQLELASPESIAACAMSAAMAAGSAEATINAGRQAREELQATADTARQRLLELEGQVGEVASSVGQLLADVRADHERNEAQRNSTLMSWISKRVTGFEVQIAQLRGPKGATGNPGTCVTIGSGKPKDASVFESLIGRGAIVGDIYIDGTDEYRRAYRWTGRGFEAGPAMSGPTQVRDVKISALDASTKVYPTQTSTTPTSSGSGGGEKLMVRTATSGGSLRIADSSNWTVSSTANQDPVSGTLFIEIVATDGSLAGHRGYASIAFTYSDGRDETTEYALVGDLAQIFRCDLTVSRTAAAVPAGLSFAIPSGALRTTLDLTIVPEGASGGTTNFLVNGAVIWAMSSTATAILPGTASEQPAWNWN